MIKILKSLYRDYFMFQRRPNIVLKPVDYNEYWKNRRGVNLGKMNEFQTFRYNWIIPKIEQGASVLDIGCGDGSGLMLLKNMKNIEAIGCDVSTMAVDYLRNQGFTAFLIDIQDKGALDSIQPVDHIILYETLEHLQDPETFLKNILPLAKKSVFFSFPNSGYYIYRVRFLLGSFPVQWRTHPGEHLRYWTKSDLLWWLKQLNISSKTEIKTYEGIPYLNKLSGSLFGMGFVGEIKK